MMSTHKHINAICCIVLAFSLLITVLLMACGASGIVTVSHTLGYESRLFDTSRVHSIDIVMDDWDSFLSSCTDEQYVNCSLVIDNQSYQNVAIRAKGNTSLSSVLAYGNNRYSFKVEFDHYESGKSYYGLDKLSLNNIIQDNTYLKDYLCYQMMASFGVDAPLCSYVYITVNGQDWGLYLAVEGVEESFLSRNYGSDYGQLYKPDSASMGGGRGNGGRFDLDQFQLQEGQDGTLSQENSSSDQSSGSGSGDDTIPGGGSGDGSTDATPGMGEPPRFPNGNQSRDKASSSDSSGDGSTDTLPGMGEAPAFPGGDQSRDSSSGDNSGDGSADALPGMGGGPDGDQPGGRGGMGNGPGGMDSDDVSLIYSDDSYDSYSNIFDNAKTDPSDSDKDRLIASLKQLNQYQNIQEVVDVDEVLRYFVVHNFVCNFDSYTGSMIHNYYLYEDDGQFSMIPWDYNLAFGGFMSMGGATSLVNYPIDSPVSGGTVDSRPMLAWIFQDDSYTQLYHQYFAQFIADTFDSGAFLSMMDQVVELISPYVQKDPTKFCSYEEFRTGVSTLEQFCTLRAQSIAGQLDGSIPSTSDGQSADPSSLIDASNLSIDDMGSMSSGMGRDPGDRENRQTMGDTDASDPSGQDPGNAQENGSSGSSSQRLQTVAAGPSVGDTVATVATAAIPGGSQGGGQGMQPPSGDPGAGMGTPPAGMPGQQGQNGGVEGNPPDLNSNDSLSSQPASDDGSSSNFSGSSQDGFQNQAPPSGNSLPQNQNEMPSLVDRQDASVSSDGLYSRGFILLAASVLVLGIGLVVASLIKGKNW